MLLALFILFQVVALVLFGFAFSQRVPLLWALVGVITALLSISAWGVDTVTPVKINETQTITGNVTTVSYGVTDYTTRTSEPWLGGINIAFFSIAVIYFFVDTLQTGFEKGTH